MKDVYIRTVRPYRLLSALLNWFNLLHTTYNSQNKWTKILGLEMTIFGLKVMVKSGLEENILKFNVPLQSCCCQKGLKWPGWLAGIFEGVHGVSKYFFLDHFST